MNVETFLVQVQSDGQTRFSQDPEYFRAELRAYAEKLFQSATEGPVPAVTVTLSNSDRALRIGQ